MADGLVAHFKHNPGQAIAGVAALLGLGVAGWMLVSFLTRPDLAGDTNRRTMIDAVTREVFVDMPLPTGATIPFDNPKTGEPTLFQAEACYWDSDGQRATLEPTWVLLNEHIGVDEPTLCPDCGRRVVGHNPLPPNDLMVEAAQREAPGG